MIALQAFHKFSKKSKTKFVFSTQNPNLPKVLGVLYQ